MIHCSNSETHKKYFSNKYDIWFQNFFIYVSIYTSFELFFSNNVQHVPTTMQKLYLISIVATRKVIRRNGFNKMEI